MNTKTLKKYLIERDEKYKCWSVDTDIFPNDITWDCHFFDHDNYPENSHDFYLFKTGEVLYCHHDCYPEYSMIGYWVENGIVDDTDWRCKTYYSNTYEYCKEVNDLSWCSLYDSLEDFWNDPLTNASKVLSCSLNKKLFGLYHPKLSKYNSYGLGIDWWVIGKLPQQKLPKNYQHWITLIYGCDIKSTSSIKWDIYYPLKPLTNQEITVICKNGKKVKRIAWKNGKHGLTKHLLSILFPSFNFKTKT